MHIQTLLIVAFAVFCGIQCLPSPPMDGDWDWRENYELKDDYKSSYDRKNKYNDDDDDDDGYDKYDRKNKYDDDDDYKPSYDRKNKYNDDDGYDKYDNDGYDKYDDDNDDYKERRPSKYSNKPKDVGHMNVYFREPSKDGKRKKPKRFRFPVAHYEREHFPRTFGPLISFMPWLPIFADRLTKQTIIYSPTGGVYILPPVINFYGKLISVAQLISSGYASLVSTGAPPPPAVDVAPLVQPGAVVGPGVPTVDTATGGFKGAVRTEYRSFPKAKYSGNYEGKADYSQKDDYSKPKVGY